MTRGVRWYLVGSLAVVALTGCKPSFMEEREPWRRDAEMACLKTGAVKESPSVVLLGPISGPGMCGADFPLKVGALGEDAPLSYTDEPVRPPSDIPQAAPAYPRRPLSAAPSAYPSGSYPPNAPFAVNPSYPADTRLPPNPQPGPQSGPQYRGAPNYRAGPSYPPNTPFSVNPDYPADTRLPPRGTGYHSAEPYEPAAPYPDAGRGRATLAPAPYRPASNPPSPYYSPAPQSRGSAADEPISLIAPGINPPGGDRAGDYQPPLPRYGAPRTVPARAYPSPANADEPPYRPVSPAPSTPFASSYPGGGQSVPLSPSRAPFPVATTASVSPPATLACPIVSTLDRWISEAVQPAAQKWFGAPVTGIRQISAYSCRGMNGNPNAHISEHAFGNALDIASFEFANGRQVTVQQGWHGALEEQGFLRDVQAAACEMFTTVLAPGSNVYHYNHIHVDLMRRASGRTICEPRPVSGDAVAARLRGRDGSITGSIGSQAARRGARVSAYEDENVSGLPDAVPGED